MAQLKRSLVTPLAERKKTTCPKGCFKSKAQKNTELVLKLLRAYQI